MSGSPLYRWMFACMCCATSLTALAADTLVTVTSAELRPVVEEVPISGSVSSPRVARLSPEVSGLVSQVLVDAGDRVGQGAELLRLDSTLAAIDLDATEAATEQAREELADARRRLKDAQRLRKSKGIAETEYESRRSEVRADAAALKQREAQQLRQQERLNRYRVLAPFAGVISRKQSEVGEWVDPGDQVFELVADQGLRLDFQVNQSYFPRVDRDTRLRVRMDALPERPLQARIGEIVPVSDPNARTFVVRAYPEEQGLPLTPGMSASGTLLLGTGQPQVVVARDALIRHPDGRVTAWVVVRDGDSTQVDERRVRIGLAFDGQVAVRGGLKAGEQVVLEGNEALRQGQGVVVGESP